MDTLKNLASSAASVQEYLNGIHFPIKKDDLVQQLQQREAPEPIVERIRTADLSKFENAQQVLDRARG
jgi:hypothetical protein